MADSTAIFTFQDPSSSFFVEENLDLQPLEDTLDDNHNYLNLENDQTCQEWDNLFDSEDPLSDPVLWEICHDNGDVGNSGNDDNLPENPVSGDQSMPLSVISVPASQYNCICCQILREITHTNGTHVKRLEIHGVFGVITHAVLGIFDCATSLQTQDFQMFDFVKESNVTVKNLLIQYFEACKLEGYIPMQDPLSTFYDALSVGLYATENTNDFLQLSPQNIGDCQYNKHETLRRPEGGSNRRGFMKIPLALQRERTRKLKLEDFIGYFDVPIQEAARKMNICPTVMKKVCRKNGVSRWPYRKIKSIERKLSKLAKISDTSSDNEERRRATEDIEKYRQKLASIYHTYTKKP